MLPVALEYSINQYIMADFISVYTYLCPASCYWCSAKGDEDGSEQDKEGGSDSEDGRGADRKDGSQGPWNKVQAQEPVVVEPPPKAGDFVHAVYAIPNNWCNRTKA